MYFGRVRETTTTTGTGTVTLAGAVTQYQAFQTQNQVGDSGIDYTLLDGNGTAWEFGTGTLATSSTFSRDVIDNSSNSGSAINLSANTHKIFLSFNATSTNKRLVEADTFIDYIVSGLVLPTTSGTLAGTISAGQAYVVGQRVVKGAQAHTYTASKDTYVDLDNLGVLHYSAVNNAAGAPALTANSLRLGFVTTNASVITGATTAAKDSLGNWMGNTYYQASCLLAATGLSVAVASGGTVVAIPFAAGTEILDNAGQHSTSTNNTRITIAKAGLYLLAMDTTLNSLAAGGPLLIQFQKNGTVTIRGQEVYRLNTADTPAMAASTILSLVATDYVEATVQQYTGGSQNITGGGFEVVRVG